MTLWSPDTCGCKIQINIQSGQDYSDDGVTATAVQQCAAHASIADGTTHLRQLHKENKTANHTLAHAQGNIPGSLGQTACTFCSKYGVAAHLSFDANRNIVVTTKGWQSADVATLQNHCDTTFGVGSVLVV